MNRRQLVGSLGTLGLAGCLRLTESTRDGAETTEEMEFSTDTEGTEASAGTEATTEGDEVSSYPTGLHADGVESYLSDAHVNALAETSFRAQWREENVSRAETMHARDVRVDGRTALASVPERDGLRAYHTADGIYWREELADGASYGRNRGTFDHAEIAKARRLRMVLLAGAWNPPEPADGGSEFDITADGVDDPTAIAEEFEAETVESFEAEGVVTDRGIIRRLVAEMEFISEEEDRLYKVRLRHRVENVGDVTVSEPDWYETAKAEAPDVSARIEDQRFLVMEHRGGNPIEPGTHFVIYDRDGRGNWGYRDNARRVEAGTTMYLWMEDDRLRWRRGARPTDANPQSLDGRYGFWAHRNGFEYFGNIELPR